MNNYPIRVFEAFAGYGSQSIALERLAADYPLFKFSVVGISEIDKYAISAYRAIHGDTAVNFGDIMHIDWQQVPDFDLLTYSFPCQDISSAGRQRGFAQGSGTRSSCLWACADAIKAKRPKFLLMENVKALMQRKFAADFSKWRDWLGGKITQTISKLSMQETMVCHKIVNVYLWFPSVANISGSSFLRK